MQQVFTKENTEVLQYKDGTYSLFDFVLLKGGKIVSNTGHWGKNECVDKRRITLDDHQMFCAFSDANCRIRDLGFGVRSYIIPDEKPFFTCKYHTLEVGLTRRYMPNGIEVLEGWHP